MLDNADVVGFSDIVSWLPGSTNSFKVYQPADFVEGYHASLLQEEKRSRGKIQVKTEKCTSSAAPLV
jgi:hypothetical protein